MTETRLHHDAIGEGTPVVLLHGNPLDHHSLLPLEPAFENSDGRWLRLYLDLPGFGESAADETIDSTRSVADAAEAWIHEHLHDEEFALVGHSFGGMIARELTGRFGSQVLGTALIAPVVVAARPQRHTEDRPAPQPIGPWLDAAAPADRASFLDNAASYTERTWQFYRDCFLPGLARYDRAAVRRIESDYALPWAPEQRYGYPEAPTLWLLGRHDATVGYRDQVQVAGGYPEAETIILDDAGHMPQIEAPEQTQSAISSWLSRLRRPYSGTTAPASERGRSTADAAGVPSSPDFR